MSISQGKNAPYAPFGCVIAVIKRLRERGLPEILTIQEIVRVGVSEGNASRTLQALRFLKLIDEEGYRTQIFDRLARVPTNEYSEVFGQIIREAYRDVFTIIDPADATDIAINDAFRYYHPQAQRARMVTLFKSLCQEVGLMDGGPPETRKRVKRVMSNKLSNIPFSRKEQSEGIQKEDVSYLYANIFAKTDYALLLGLLQKLPVEKKWTQEQRKRWLQAFTANIDLMIDVEN